MLRVLFTLVPLITIGFLTGVTAMRIAIVTRRAWDWVYFVVSVVVTIGSVASFPEDTDSAQMDVAMSVLLLNAAAAAAYFLYADIRHHERLGAHPGVQQPGRPPFNPYATTMPPQGGGYAHPQQQTAPQLPPQPQPQSPPYTAAPAPTPAPAPPAAPPQSPRINQVRAELDELSDLLRKEEGK
ncbi:hypothetical protein [Streptomyces purpureus]|uniref:hypothetical protein n=1 Tax=Streptomyces purpureus TaxID=1951 RepID=UPI001E53C8EC|nr:hypothetical protein [Streptomyces purpureus]